MRNDTPFFLTKLTVLALVAVLAGCGGGEGGGSDQNQSSTQKPDNSDGGQAAKVPGANKRVNVVKSVNNALQLNKSLHNQGFKFPDSDKWCDAVLQEVGGNQKIFYSAQHPDTAKLKNGASKDKPVSHYAMNKAMSGKGGSDGEVVLVFECDLGWNGAGGLEDALKYMDKFKLEKIAVSKVSGSSIAVTKEELKKLKWEIAP